MPARGHATGPSAPDRPGEPPTVVYPPAPSLAIGKRLSPTDRDALIAAFNAGTSQQHLATEYGISIRSVKRLVHGNSNRPQATANRLAPEQRHTKPHRLRSPHQRLTPTQIDALVAANRAGVR